ncbi:MAG: sugar kinase, partial [Chloroflexota bacterium]
EYEAAHRAYARSLAELKRLLPRSVKQQFIDRSFLPTFTFGPKDLVVTLGPDGLVVNTAKYLTEQVMIALNPDPERIDGVLNPLHTCEVSGALEAVSSGHARVARVSMAKVSLNDGREMAAVNDLFIGPKSHGSLRYRLEYRRAREEQSSSGIIVSTGAGSTGWLKSIVAGSLAVAAAVTGQPAAHASTRFDWEAESLKFFVREPFASRTTRAGLVAGTLEAREELTITSWMPESGVIFSDGVEADYLPFNAGSIARIGVSERKAHLVQRTW